MKYITIPPPGELSAFVKFFWVFEAEELSLEPYTHFSTASIYPRITFSYKGCFKEISNGGKAEDLFYSGIQAQTKNFARLVTGSTAIGVLGACLYPHAIPMIFSIPASVISSQAIDLKELMGREGTQLEEQVMLAESNMERIDIISRFIGQLIRRSANMDQRIIKAIQCLSQINGPVNFKEFTERYCLSQRQFERKFKELTGFPPKLFSRISRFESAIYRCIGGNTPLTEIAYSCGYYDQAHFIHEFREFTGFHPRSYLSHATHASVFIK